MPNMGFQDRLSVVKPLLHLMLPFFIHVTGVVVCFPAITDVAVNALCPKGATSCSLAIYTSGISQTVAALGTMFITPVVGALSDTYGRRPLIILCTAISIIPYAILAYSTTFNFVMAYFVVRSLLGMLTEGTSTCLTLAFVADVIAEEKRAAAFGVTMSALSIGLMVGTGISRLVPTAYVFQIAALSGVLSTVYLFFLLPETAPRCCRQQESALEEGKGPAEDGPKLPLLTRNRSELANTIAQVRRSPMLLQLALLAFCSTFGESGMTAGLFFYLKAVFGFNKDQFAELMLILGVSSLTSQILFLPLFVHFVGVRGALLTGLFFSAVHGVLYGVAWAPWVPFLSATCAAFTFFVFPAVGSIVSSMASADEQGKLQGVLSGVRSLASALAPLIFNPLLAFFISDSAPFRLPGTGILIATLFTVAALVIGALLPRLPAGQLRDGCKDYRAVPSSDVENEPEIVPLLREPYLPPEVEQVAT